MMFDSAELQLQKKCSRYGVRHYVNPDETESERSERHQKLGNECTAENRRRDAERKRNARKIESDETKKKEAQRKKEARKIEPVETKKKEAQRKKEAYNKSDETRQREAQRKRDDRLHQSEQAKQHDAQRKRDDRLHQSEQAKQRDALRKRDDRLHQSEQAKQHDAQRKRDAYNKSDETRQLEAKRKRDAYHESEETEKLQAAKKRSYRKNKKSKALINDTGHVDREDEALTGDESIDIPDILKDVDIESAAADALKYLLRTKDKDGKHQMPVCVSCDQFVYGIEEVKSLSKELLLKNKNRLSRKNFETHFSRKLSSSLVTQYQVKDEELHDLLLSPRSLCTGDAYQACPSCYNALTGSANQKRKTPPVKSIANGNIFGQVPTDVIEHHNLTEVLSAALSLQRPYGFLFSWRGGKHTAIQGSHSFFDTDQTHIGGVINHFNSANANAHIKCVIAGRMTPRQKKIIQARATIQPAHYLAMLGFLKKEHPGYSTVTLPTETSCSEEGWQPQHITDKENAANVDDEGDKDFESTVLGGTYVFSSAHDPQQDSGVFNNSSDFICALLKRVEPTMMIYGGKYTSGRELDLSLVFPLLFPYGFGSPKMKRRVCMLLEQCLKTYMRVSIPHFRQAQFILVCLHLLNRKLSYKSGNMMCKLKPSGSSMNIAEKLSTFTPEELNSAADRRAKNLPINKPADAILKKVVTSCKPIGQSSAAAKAARRNYLALSDHFGLGSIFSTVSPCDQCSFRVQLFARPGCVSTLPPLDASQDDCFLDFNIRKNVRSSSPGACALEFDNIMQILVHCMIGWDSKKKQGRKGIFGVVEAFGATIEEQARYTLHAHMIIWIRLFAKLRALLFHANKVVRDAARSNYLAYISNVMCATFGDMTVQHTCKDNQAIPMNVQDNFTCDPQILRNSRSRHLCKEISGKVLQCKHCSEEISTTEIINLALARWSDLSQSNVSVPISKERLDIAAYRFPYDILDPESKIEDTFWGNKEARQLLLTTRFNEHDYLHRPGCFKHGDECRFYLPQKDNPEVAIDEDWGENKENFVQVYHLDGVVENIVPFVVLPQRHMGSQFVNTHNTTVSNIFSCNSNVQIGDPSHIFYNTLYTSKVTQEEDRSQWTIVATQIIRRILRARSEAMSSETANEPDYVEGLCRFLSGMTASMSRDIVSSTLGHYLVLHDSSRFMFSHDFQEIPLAQLYDVLSGKEVLTFRIRRNRSKTSGETVAWADSFANNYLHRPKELEEICLYKMTSEWEMLCLTFKQMKEQEICGDNGTEALDDEAVEEDSEEDDQNEEVDSDIASVLKFSEGHPGREFSHLARRKFEVIPRVSIPVKELCRIKELEITNSSPSKDVIKKREMYSLNAMLQFFPHRTLEDLKGEDGTFWTKFVQSKNDGSFWSKGLEILENIDLRNSLHCMTRARDPLTKETETPKVSEEEKSKNKKQTQSSNTIDLSEFDEEVAAADLARFGPLHAIQETMRTHKNMIDQQNHITRDAFMSTEVRQNENSSFLTREGGGVPGAQSSPCVRNVNSSENGVSLPALAIQEKNYPTLVSLITDTLKGGGYDSAETMYLIRDRRDECSSELPRVPTLEDIARKVRDKSGIQLDEKQYIAYEIIACSFLLHHVNSGNATFGSSDASSVPERSKLLQSLRARGGKDQLIMFLTGFAGAGKSCAVTVAEQFCFEFCHSLSIRWSSRSFFFTATTGVAAALVGGGTIHGGAFLNCNYNKIDDEMKARWMDVVVLVIDEISFFSMSLLRKLNKHLQFIRGCHDKPFGGIHIVFVGDFHQLDPIATKASDFLYRGATNGLWEGSLNVAIFLEDTHRFRDDPEFGEVLKKLWRGQFDRDDKKYINSRVVGPNVNLPDVMSGDISYACPSNLQRNQISWGIFDKRIRANNPLATSNDPPPDHTIIIEADIQSKSSSRAGSSVRVSSSVREMILSTCGDNDIRVTKSNSKGDKNDTSRGGQKIDPALRLYQGCPGMGISNKDLDNGVGNGTAFEVLRVQLKEMASSLRWTNWDGYKVQTVSVTDVAYVECMHRKPRFLQALEAKLNELEAKLDPDTVPGSLESVIATLKKEIDQATNKLKFKLKPVSFTATASVAIDSFSDEKHVFSGVKITQIPMNLNDATTGHKLQGCSREKLIVASFTKQWKNWIYVVLSRVRTLAGLYLLEPLDEDDDTIGEVPQDLIDHEERLRRLEASVLDERRTRMAQLH